MSHKQLGLGGQSSTNTKAISKSNSRHGSFKAIKIPRKEPGSRSNSLIVEEYEDAVSIAEEGNMLQNSVGYVCKAPASGHEALKSRSADDSLHVRVAMYIKQPYLIVTNVTQNSLTKQELRAKCYRGCRIRRRGPEGFSLVIEQGQCLDGTAVLSPLQSPDGVIIVRDITLASLDALFKHSDSLTSRHCRAAFSSLRRVKRR